jgi:hypothetical protein
VRSGRSDVDSHEVRAVRRGQATGDRRQAAGGRRDTVRIRSDVVDIPNTRRRLSLRPRRRFGLSRSEKTAGL